MPGPEQYSLERGSDASDYDAIFAEEKERIQKEHPGSNLAPGSQEVEELHRRTNERLVSQLLDRAVSERLG